MLLRSALIFLFLVRAVSAQVPVYNVTDVRAIYSPGVEYVAAINDAGQVASTTTARKAFVWDNGQVTVLPSLQPSNDSFPHRLTNDGVVIGVSMVDVQSHAVLWPNGMPMDLGVLGGINSEANARNTSGQVVGSWRLSSASSETHAFLYDSGNFTDLGGLGGINTRAKGINVAGTVVGGSRLAQGPYTHAFTWSNGRMTDIGAWAGNTRESVANAINDAGTVVGTIAPPSGNGWLAFVYEDGQMTTIPGLPTAEQSIANAINVHRQIAGVTQFPNGSQVATLFQDGAAYDLNTLIPVGSGWQLIGASDINDQGQIVGLGLFQGNAHAFLLSPTGVVAPYCTSTPNSTGAACTIAGEGVPSITQNEFELVAAGAVPDKPGLFFYNTGQMQVPFGNGFLCVGGGAPAIFRLGPAVVSDASGVAVFQLDVNSGPAATGPGAVHALATWNFQYYYRDLAAGGAGFNLSNAIAVTFCP